MRSILTVTAPAAEPYMLTSVARVKLEHDITVETYDNLIEAKIKEAGSDIQAYLRFVVARESVRETFRPDGEGGYAAFLLLNRTPVASIASVTVDDVVLETSEYEVDAKAGILHRLDLSGYPCPWEACKSIIIEYTGGYALPDDTASDLEPAIEAGCLELVSQFWLSRGRDPLIRSEEVPGVMSVQYWVGAVGEAGQLPPSVISKIAPFRRPSV